MLTSSNDGDSTLKKPVSPDFSPIYDFYRPHRRADTWATGLKLNELTGELAPPIRRVKQEFRDESDINNILKQYKLTGQIRHISAKAAMGAYQDLPDPIEFQDAMNLVISSEESFSTLPAHVRDRFGNDPVQFLEFMANPANQDEAIKLGLAKDSREPVSGPPSSPPVSPAPPAPPSEPAK